MTEDCPSPERDIHAYLAEFDDIPGTRVFTAKRARQGYQLNQFAMSLMKAENRERWKADEAAYLADWKLTPEQKQAVLDRDYTRLLDLGGNIYFLSKIFSTDGKSFLQAVSTMSGMSLEDYAAMMIAGGRSPEGVRSIRANAAKLAPASGVTDGPHASDSKDPK
jgi:protocatechuate 4,5-dioxygenase alpha chain